MTIGIGLGMSRFPFDKARDYFEWVDYCEDKTVDSIWQTDRLVSKDAMLECMSVMAALAGRTEKIRFGMNVVSIALRDPLLMAKQCATIDFLSDGRILPAFGLGSAFSQDYSATGTPTKRRGKKADEALELLARLWTEDSVSFDGEFFQYDNACISPKPANAHIPLWIGGSSEVAMKRTAKYGTGWLGGIDTPEQAKIVVAGIKDALKDTGRKIDEDHYGASFLFRFGSPEDEIVAATAKGFAARIKESPDRYLVAGDAADIIVRIREFLDAGCEKFVMLPMANGTADVMEQTRLFVEQVQPEFC
ncbi:MAG: LLM class flavin-dependent oxidoreductase [Pseudomonadales bacterium]|jgi:probable F420-dependent oxidoreductase|nr:LLM class flavin-dependent oxidoreductase [Pseudomonadales bacterium]